MSFGSPQHSTVYTPSPGTSMKPFRMVKKIKLMINPFILKSVVSLKSLYDVCYLGRYVSMENTGNSRRENNSQCHPTGHSYIKWLSYRLP